MTCLPCKGNQGAWLARAQLGLGVWLVTSGLSACAKSPAAEDREGHAPSAAEASEVAVAIVTARELEEAVEISGTLAADESVTVAVKVPGRLTSIAIDLASPVQRGQVIAQIERLTYELRVQEARAALRQALAQLGLPESGKTDELSVEDTAIVRQAQATLNETRAGRERAEALVREGIMTGAELDSARAAAVRAETAVQSAREEVQIRKAAAEQRRLVLRMAQQDLADTLIRSPIDGSVQSRTANVGEYFAAGMPIAQIVKIDPLRLRVAVPEREATSVRQGQEVHVALEGDGQTYAGQVARVAPSLDQGTRSLLVEADIPNPTGLRPGHFVRARIVVGTATALTVPKGAITTFAGLQKVIMIEGGKAVERRITVGRSQADYAEVLTGLQAGDRVVVNPGSLQQGQPVRVREGA